FRENVKIISSMLPFTTKGHFERIKNSYIKALEPGKNDPDILREIETINNSTDMFKSKKPIWNTERSYVYDYDQEKVLNFFGADGQIDWTQFDPGIIEKIKADITAAVKNAKGPVAQAEALKKAVDKAIADNLSYKQEKIADKAEISLEKVSTESKKKNTIVIIAGLAILAIIMIVLLFFRKK
ncbi:MAG: hypothetical protein PHS34_09145, partial [Candidatus Omnitrophica bacterium]|nr:hypothetical protein [Candidatus Omnitrophota bacterium]